MYILSPSYDCISEILNIDSVEHACDANHSLLSQFEWQDLTALGKPLCFRGESPELGTWANVILERNAASSQLVRLRRWCGASVMTVALTGNGFIGQKDRVWQTFEGNLHWCAAIPVKMPIVCAELLQMIPAICMHEVLQPYWKDNIQCRIKRPNDIILLLPEPHKIAGCLTEMRANARSIEIVRYGLSINLVAAPENVEAGHLPAACCAPYFKSNDSVYRNVLMALSRSILENVRFLERNPLDTDLRSRFESK